MSFVVEETRCRRCGVCAADCVCACIVPPMDGVPHLDPSLGDLCVHCGHCSAVCPEGAITLDGVPADALGHTDSATSEQSAAALLQGRRAIRNFQPSPVDEGLLRKALALAAYAPTAHNAREVAYTILNGRRKVETLLQATVQLMEKHGMFPGHTASVRKGCDTLFRGAHCLILIHAPERVLSETDCATAACYLELALPPLGLGSCWAGMLIEACVHGLPKGILLPEGHRLYAALMVGAPNISYARVPFRSAPAVRWV